MLRSSPARGTAHRSRYRRRSCHTLRYVNGRPQHLSRLGGSGTVTPERARCPVISLRRRRARLTCLDQSLPVSASQGLALLERDPVRDRDVEQMDLWDEAWADSAYGASDGTSLVSGGCLWTHCDGLRRDCPPCRRSGKSCRPCRPQTARESSLCARPFRVSDIIRVTHGSQVKTRLR